MSTRPELEAREDGRKCGLGNFLPEKYWRNTGECFNSDPVKVYVILVVFFLLKATAVTPSKYSDVKTELLNDESSKDVIRTLYKFSDILQSVT